MAEILANKLIALDITITFDKTSKKFIIASPSVVEGAGVIITSNVKNIMN